MSDVYFLMTSNGPNGFNMLLTQDKGYRDDRAKALAADGYLVRAYQGTFAQMVDKAVKLQPSDNLTLSSNT